MLRMMGAERVDSSSRTKAMKNSMDRGVAGRSMMAANSAGWLRGLRRARDRLSRLQMGVMVVSERTEPLKTRPTRAQPVAKATRADHDAEVKRVTIGRGREMPALAWGPATVAALRRVTFR